MSAPTSTEIRESIRSRLYAMVEHLGRYTQEGMALKELGVDNKHESLWFSSAVESVLTFYFNSLCESLTLQNAAGTPAKVSLPAEYFQFTRGYWRDGSDDFDPPLNESLRLRLVDSDDKKESRKALLDEIIHRIDCDRIEKVLNDQICTLVDDGLVLMCNTLVSVLNAGENCREYYKPKRRGRHLICHGGYFGSYDYQILEYMNKLRQVIGRIDADAGLNMTYSVDSLTVAVRNLSWNERIPSRTVFGKGSPLEIVCFKDKYEFRLTMAALDAVIAFITLHGDKTCQSAAAWLTNIAHAEKAA